jgi:hypothetical protein
MSQLVQLQADFQAYLYDDVKGAAFKAKIINDQKVGAKKRLDIYYNAYRLRIIDVLSNDYPNVRKLLGDDLFERTARSYIDKHPSTYPNMRWVGQKMSAHLTKTLPQHPVAAELATFEWALGLAFDAEDTPILGLPDLAAIPPENWAELRFTFQPSLQILALKYNALEVWKALDRDAAPVKHAKTNMPCIVWRQDMNSFFRSIDAAELNAIKQMMAGASFGDLCEKLQEDLSEEEATQNAAQYLATWLNEGLIAYSL